ncbi:MAG TPA: argininosuccinate lyase [Sphaerochaeta sp.]|nr:argininosuccinate lyase [Sphaerochaeta sp.]
MAKLWQKTYTLDSLMEEFSVGSDYLIDQHLVVADVLGSIAHARTLERAGILTVDELQAAQEALVQILTLKEREQFPITLADEDCHTAIETYLTEAAGEVGKKIHTGRSRNDQVQTALRLWMREFTLRLALSVSSLAEGLFGLAAEHSEVPMPGRTHMQIAMPSSVGLWAASFAEQLADQVAHLIDLHARLDQSPLGSAASYGSPLALDRAYSASLMGFSRVQNNVLYANNSRGLFEAMLLDSCDYIGLTLSKLAQDLMLFTLPEFGYFTLPVELLTGSSIMPQKQNPDGLELARSRSARIHSATTAVKGIIRSLPSGYNRDFQDTKEPLFTGTKSTWDLVQIFTRMVEGLEVNEEALIAACTPELYATDVVLARVSKGESFRDVYQEVGAAIDTVVALDPREAIALRTALGTSGNLQLQAQEAHLFALKERALVLLTEQQERFSALAGGRDIMVVDY